MQEEVDAEVRAAAEVKRRDEEEAKRQRMADEKATRLEERREGLRVARVTLAEEFRAKTVSKEALRERNAVLQAEAKAIEEEEREDETAKEVGVEIDEGEEQGDEGDKDEGEEGLPVVYTRKRKVEVDEGEDEADELEETRTGGEAKRSRLEKTGLLSFKGPVSHF